MVSSDLWEEPMRDGIDPAWQQTEAPDWPTPAELDDLVTEWTDEEWEAEHARIMVECYGPLPTRSEPRPHAVGEEELT